VTEPGESQHALTVRELRLTAIDLVATLASSSGNSTERTRAEQWRHLSPEHERAWQDAERAWQLMGQLPPPAAASIIRLPRTLLPRSRRKAGAALAAAAALLVVLVIHREDPTPESATSRAVMADASLLTEAYGTEWGQRRRVSLADGSTVHLNFDSAIRVGFDSSHRNVELIQGEALFEVAKDPVRPFVVSAAEVTAAALGTRFIVRRLDHDAARITVTEGRVGVAVAAGPSVEIGADQTVESTGAALGEVRVVKAADSAAWQRGMLVFRNATLESVLREIDRYTPYRITAHLGDQRSAQVTGTFFIDRLDEGIDTLISGFGLAVVSRDAKELQLTFAPPSRRSP